VRTLDWKSKGQGSIPWGPTNKETTPELVRPYPDSREVKLLDGCVTPWTTKNEWYEFHKLERSQVVVKIGLVAQRKSVRLLSEGSGYRDSPSPQNLKIGFYMVIVAELVKRLIVVQEIVGSSPTFHT
jgi:hypothetical protein